MDPYYDPYYVELNLTEINERYKPLLGIVIQLNMLIFYPLSHLLYKSHFAFYGRQIVRLLDAAEMRQIKRHGLALVKLAILFVLTYIFLHEDILRLTIAEEGFSLASKTLKVVASLSVYLDMFFTYGIVLYFKLAMRQKLSLVADQTRMRMTHCRLSDRGGYVPLI